MVLVKTFYAHNDLRNFSYLIYEKITGASWVIDPYDPHTIGDYIKKNGLVLKGILNTHQHSDHIRGNLLLSKTFSCPVLSLQVTDQIQLSPLHFIKVLNTPGHTLDHKAFLWIQNKEPLALFAGDTLFNAGVGNCKGGGDVDLLFQSTTSLKSLPSATLLYPGHDYKKRNLEFSLTLEPENKDILEGLRVIEGLSTENFVPVNLGEEMKVNPFFRLDSHEIRQNLKKKFKTLSRGTESDREFFRCLRELRDNW
jgi:hydroxyacylglutathione hydrolase